MVSSLKLRVAGLLALSLLSLAFGSTLWGAGSRSCLAHAAANLRESPLGQDNPVPVRVGLYLADLATIDEASESFEIQGYLYASWHDDRLIGNSRCRSTTIPLDPKEVWNPELDLANVRTFRSFGSFFFCYPDGTVSWEEHFDARLSNEFYLRRFPFDRQILLVTIQPFISPERGDENPVEFSAKSYGTGVSSRAYLSAWKIERIRYQRGFEKINVASKVVPQAWFAIVVKRRSGFYAWQVFLPLALMVMIPWTVFWVSVKEFDWQMKIPLATMLTMVAFEFAISRDLPRVSYLTFLDAVFLTSFVFTFLTIVEVVVAHVLVMSERMQAAARIHKLSRWIFPLAFVVLVAALVPIFLVGAGRPQ
jgi:hypothetical protein